MNRLQIEQAIEEHGEHLLKIAYFIVKNRATAEDIVQDVFVQLLGKTKYEERGQQRAYLTKLTANRSKDYLRSWRYRMTQLVGTKEKTSSFQQRDELQVLEEKYEFGQAILQLPLKYREPIIYYYYEQWSLIEIANHLHIPLNTVKTHLRKGRELLRKALENENWEVLLDETMEADLDGIAGDFSEEKNRLSKGIDAKLAKTSSKKSLRFSVIILLVVSIIGVFVYQWMNEPPFSKTYSSDSPVYFDEKMYKFYQAMLYEVEDEQERNNEAFMYLISVMAQEHTAYENGYVFDEQAYEKMLNSIINRYKNNEPDEYIIAGANLINMSEERFIKTIAAPLEAKTMIMYEATAHLDSHLLYINGIAMYEQEFEKEINELANLLDVQYKKIMNHFGYTGVVIAKEEGKILVVTGATTYDMESMAVSEIVTKYNTGIWFNMDQLSTNVNVGDTVMMYYEAIDHSLPGNADAIDMYVVEKAKKEPIYYDESLFYYFTLFYSHIEDEMVRHEKAFELYLEWLSIEERAADMGYELNSSMYELLKTEVLDEFETTIGSPPFKETAIIELTKLRTLPSNQALHEILAGVEVQQRLIHQYMNGQVIVPYDHNSLTYFKIEHEHKIEELANQLGLFNYNQDHTIPFYIGRIVAIENGEMKVITGITSDYLIALSDQQIEQMKETALSFEYSPVPRLSVGDIVKIHYDEFKADTPMKPIKISIIIDTK